MKFIIITLLLDAFFGLHIDDTEQNLLKENTPSAIVFYSNYSCHDCFYDVKDAIEEIDNVNKVVLIRCNNSILQRREMMQGTQKIFGSKWRIFFDIHESEDIWPPNNLKEGLFGYYNVSKTPAVILTYKDSVLFIPFKKTVNKKLFAKEVNYFKEFIEQQSKK
jgi:hypothetical protein